MSRRGLNLLLFLAFLASLGLYAVTGRDLTQRNFEVMPDMAHSSAYDTYAPNPNFPDGKTFQLPEAGTIARGRLPLHYGPSAKDAIRAGAELHNPAPWASGLSAVGLGASPLGTGPFSTSAALITARAGDVRARERGAFVYQQFCLICHGKQGGKGDGPVMKRGMPPSPSLVDENAVEMKDGQMFHVITYGQKTMAAHAALLSRDDRWKVILHVRSLQQRVALRAVGASTAGLGASPLGTGPFSATAALIAGRAQQAAGVKWP
jgi:mono/diheme cytochrome c family protein